MLKKTISYLDYDGIHRTEEFYFNLTKAELIEMELAVDGGVAQTLQNIVDSKDNKAIIESFKDIILRAYGVRSEDGRRFIKNDQVREEFSQTAAFSELFVQLATDANAGAEFVNGLVPQDLAAEAAKAAHQNRPQPQDHRPKQITAQEPRPSQPAGESFISRPPHESGPGFQQSSTGDESYNPFGV